MANPGIGGTLGNASDVNFPTLRQAGDFLYYDDGYWRNYQLLPASNKLSITKDAANGRVSVGINEANLSLSAIGGTLTSSQLPSITSTNLASGSITPNKLDTNSDTPSGGDILSYNGSTGKFEWVGALAASQTLTNPLVFQSRPSYGGTTFTANTLDAAFTQISRRIGGGWYSVRDFGAVGDGVTDDTAAIQAALDGVVGTLYFPPGSYRVSGSGEAILTLSRNISIVGCDTRNARIIGFPGTSTTSLLKVSITNNWGLGSIKGWNFSNLSLIFDSTDMTKGLHALYIYCDNPGFSMFGSLIQSCWLEGRDGNGGHGLYAHQYFYYSKISCCAISSVLMTTHDANTFEKCQVGNPTLPGFTWNVLNGVRNSTIRDCCILARNEAIHIINGSNLRIHNNQLEQPGVSVSPRKAMMYVEGRDRVSDNIVISENNFGGGTNLDRLIVIDNAANAIIEKNNLVACGTTPALGKEIEFTANATYCEVSPNNFLLPQGSNPRPREAFRPEILDNGLGTIGVLKSVAGQNGWSSAQFFKDIGHQVNFWEPLSGGTTTAGTLIATIPVGFRPSGTTALSLVVGTSAGPGVVSVSGSTGDIRVVSLPSANGVTLPSYPCRSTTKV